MRVNGRSTRLEGLDVKNLESYDLSRLQDLRVS
jgi:hypothetical protein